MSSSISSVRDPSPCPVGRRLRAPLRAAGPACRRRAMASQGANTRDLLNCAHSAQIWPPAKAAAAAHTQSGSTAGHRYHRQRVAMTVGAKISNRAADDSTQHLELPFQRFPMHLTQRRMSHVWGASYLVSHHPHPVCQLDPFC